MTERQMRRIVEELCAEIDARDARDARATDRGGLFRKVVLPAALSTGLALAGCEPTPIELPYMGPMPDGMLHDYLTPDLGTDLAADAGPDVAGDLAVEPDGIVEPDAIEPDGIVEPDTIEPDTIEPDTIEPDTIEPDTIEPDTIEPDASEPNASGDAQA